MNISALRARPHDRRGFTLIEVLVVMLIIAILAAIAIPVFFRQRDKGFVAQVQSALANGRIAAESYRTDAGNGDFAGPGGDMDLSDLFDEGLRVADVVVLEVFVSADNETYCIVSSHPQLPTGHDWKIATQETDEEASVADVCSFGTG